MKIFCYKYKMRPTQEQKELFNKFFGCARFVYNWGLQTKKEEYEKYKALRESAESACPEGHEDNSLPPCQVASKTKAVPSAYDLACEITQMKKLPEYEWLNECSAVTLQQSLLNLDAAFNKFFKEHAGYPKFKSKHRGQDSLKFPQGTDFDFKNWTVKVPKIGYVKICKNREIPANGVPKSLVVKKDCCGDYWCTIVVHFDEDLPAKAKVEEATAVGIDVGLRNYANLSDGQIIDNPKFLESTEKQLAHLNRSLARKQKGSKNWEKARLRLAKYHRHIANKRNDFLHKTTTNLIKSDYDTFCVETLGIQDMQQNRFVARGIASASWYEFKRQLQYKADWAGKNVIAIDQFDPSSQTCHNCGYVKKDLQMHDMKWTCPQCGTKHDRHANAAQNIKDMALKDPEPKKRMVKRTKKHPYNRGCEDVEGSEPCEASKT